MKSYWKLMVAGVGAGESFIFRGVAAGTLPKVRWVAPPKSRQAATFLFKKKRRQLYRGGYHQDTLHTYMNLSKKTILKILVFFKVL